MADEVANVKALLDALESQSEDVEEKVAAFLKESSQYESSIERARYHGLVSFILLSLGYSILRLDGQDVSKHPIASDLARAQRYLSLVNELEQESDMDNLSTAEPEPTPEPTKRLPDLPDHSQKRSKTNSSRHRNRRRKGLSKS
ncbi:hypothetical protein CANCADRAFT_32980 [Tortispora caseinolytica NRRL Y-17796]|uniref:Exosome complex protein n=1 Tax=Tortispora caseinolytica NRRL Y-17796 TaxID=767744 RepID=A0A1E4T9D3_9ASCO|nr:hypothetical protein CANCADRAFT_32980 [Tortispora caseinolytica NRRL Y-17796]